MSSVILFRSCVWELIIASVPVEALAKMLDFAETCDFVKRSGRVLDALWNPRFAGYSFATVWRYLYLQTKQTVHDLSVEIEAAKAEINRLQEISESLQRSKDELQVTNNTV